MHAAVSGTRSCWRPFVTHCNPAYKLTSLPFATKLHQARAAYAAHAQSASRLLQDLADVLNEPEGDVSAAKTADGLTPWQLHKVQHAAAIGRRKVKVNELANELQIPRGNLIKLLKSEAGNVIRTSDAKLDSLAAAAATDSSQASIPQPQQAQDEATAQRQARAQTQTFEAAYTRAHAAEERQLSGAVVSTEGVGHSLPDRRANEQPSTLSRKQKRPSLKLPFAQRQQQSSDYDRKRLSKAVVATLETVYQQSSHPSDEMLQGVFELHRGVSRKKVIDWLGERRRTDKAMRRGPAHTSGSFTRAQ